MRTRNTRHRFVYQKKRYKSGAPRNAKDVNNTPTHNHQRLLLLECIEPARPLPYVVEGRSKALPRLAYMPDLPLVSYAQEKSSKTIAMFSCASTCLSHPNSRTLFRTQPVFGGHHGRRLHWIRPTIRRVIHGGKMSPFSAGPHPSPRRTMRPSAFSINCPTTLAHEQATSDSLPTAPMQSSHEHHRASPPTVKNLGFNLSQENEVYSPRNTK